MASSSKQTALTSFFRKQNEVCKKSNIQETNTDSDNTRPNCESGKSCVSSSTASSSNVQTGSMCSSEGNSNSAMESSLYPCSGVWTVEMWKKKKDTYPWLDFRDDKLGCKVCADISNVTLFTSKGLRLSHEWQMYQVSYYGEDRSTRLKSLRKKIAEHKLSKAHTAALKVKNVAKDDALGKLCDAMNASHLKTTCSIFRSAYYLAQNDRPYSDHFGLLELQKQNGVDIGTGLHSRFSANEIINHIANNMKKKICQHIKQVNGKISVLIDESTSLSIKTALIVYLKCESDKEGDPHFMFLDLLELPDQKAATIAKHLLKCLDNHGFDDSYLKQNLVAFASDGASVMLGVKSGVATILKEHYPDIITWHCLNHRLELAVGDSVREVHGINHFQTFMDKLYSVYSRSPLNQKELSECASQLEQQICKIGRALGTRWVASSFRTVSAVWQNYEALCVHFEKAMKDETRSGSDRKTYEGLLKKLTSEQFLLDLALMYDTLHELGLLSECLQKCTTSLVYADKLIQRSIRSLHGLKEKPGTRTLEAQEAIKKGKFGGITITSNNKIVSINYQQFITSLVNNLQHRMFTTTSLKGSQTSEPQSMYKSLLSEMCVLERDYWPDEIPPNYGESEISSLCKRFKLSSNSVINAFRDYVEDHGRHIPQDLHPLLNCSKVIPISTAECERGFSHMNLIITATRSRILINHVSALMFVKLHGPPLVQWNPEPYAISWLRHHRSADDTRTRIASDPRKPFTPDPLWKLL